MVGFESKQVIVDEFVDFDSQNVGPVSVSGEDFFVDHFLNLNDVEEKDDSGGFVIVKEEQFEETEMFLPLETEQNTDDFGSVLSIPAEEADLEWLSQFVEESFSQFPTPNPAQFGPISVQPKPKPGPETRTGPCFVPPLSLSKSRRSNRARTGGRVWPTVTTTSFHPSNPARTQTLPKKQRKKGVGPGNGPTRRCSHCGVQKTPQWRAGPNGSKTLCNACGVRYKSGRLLPEYRPACSPTFSSELHSNSHRRVLEMRRKKELMM